jgi:hypothetical protein
MRLLAASLAIAVFAPVWSAAAATISVQNWNATIAASTPLNWYQFNETSGSTLVDHGSQQLNGTWGTGALAPTLDVPGIFGPAAEFGNQSTAVLNGSPINSDWSAEFVLERLGSKASSVLIRGVPLQFPSTALKLEQYPNTEQFGFTQYGVADDTFSPGVPTPLNQWMDVVYENTGSAMSLYLDGVLAGTSSSSVALDRYQIGSNSDTVPESPLAIMSAAVIYNRVLSPTEIASHYAAISAVPEPSALWLSIIGAITTALAIRGRRSSRPTFASTSS